MTKLKFNQQNCGKVRMKSNDPLKLKQKYLNHHKPQIESNPNHKVEIKSNKPLESPN